MRVFSDPKCFLRLTEMQDLPISNEIGFSSKCFSRSVSPNVESSDCKYRLQCKGLSETISLPNEINVFPRNVFSECFLSATVDCSDCLCDYLLASTVAMANPAMPTVPEVQYEALTGEQLAVDVAALSGLTVEEVRSDGVQASLIALHLTGGVPETRQDLIRLATGESFVRPTAFERVTAAPGANVLTMDVEIGDESSDESLHGNQQIDAALGIRPFAETAPASEPKAEQTASAGIRRLFQCLGL